MVSDLLTHSEPISAIPVINSESPVYGDPLTALLGVLVAVLIFPLGYLILSKLPLSKKGKLTPYKEMLLAKTTLVFIFLALGAAAWDVWWHRAVGRNSFWELPHIFLYSFIGLSISLGIYGWHRTHKRIWKKLAMILFIIPIIAPFDNFWHVLFGVEDLSQPISLSWSPPHALLDLSAMAALITFLPILNRERNENAKTFFIDLIFAAIFGMALFLVMPFHPTEGWGAVMGFWGAGFLAVVIVGMMLFSQKYINHHYDVIRVTVYMLLFVLISYGKETAAGIILLPHDRPPIWLYIAPFLLMALFLDLSFRKGYSIVLRGGIAGGLWAFILFFFARLFLDPNFYYPISDAFIAIFSSILGGIIAAFFVSWIFPKVYPKLSSTV